MAFDITRLREDFPILSQKIYGKDLVYLDNGATTQKPVCVVEKLNEMYYTMNANVHRGVHFMSQEATERTENTRKIVKQFINAKYDHEIIFTKGTTDSINLIASSFCRQFCQKGDEILVSMMEHHSNIVPWQIQKDITGVELRVIPINERGELIIEEFEKLISSKTRLISLMHVSNVLGTINDIKKIIEIAHKYDVPVLIDAAQSIQHIPIDVQELDCDFLTFSAHKVYGSTGVGFLYGKEKWLDKLPPYQGGGEMIKTVSFTHTSFNDLPFKFEAGTPNYVDIVASGTALEYISNIGLESIKEHEDNLLTYCTNELMTIEGMQIYGQAENKSSVISFLIRGIHHYDMGMLLDKMGIAVRTGHHCAQPLMEHLGIEGTVRASFALYNTKDDIDKLIFGIRRVVDMFG